MAGGSTADAAAAPTASTAEAPLVPEGFLSLCFCCRDPRPAAMPGFGFAHKGPSCKTYSTKPARSSGLSCRSFLSPSVSMGAQYMWGVPWDVPQRLQIHLLPFNSHRTQGLMYALQLLHLTNLRPGMLGTLSSDPVEHKAMGSAGTLAEEPSKTGSDAGAVSACRTSGTLGTVAPGVPKGAAAFEGMEAQAATYEEDGMPIPTWGTSPTSAGGSAIGCTMKPNGRRVARLIDADAGGRGNAARSNRAGAQSESEVTSSPRDGAGPSDAPPEPPTVACKDEGGGC